MTRNAIRDYFYYIIHTVVGSSVDRDSAGMTDSDSDSDFELESFFNWTIPPLTYKTY